MRFRNLIYVLAGASFLAGMSPAAEKAAPESAAATTVQETKEQNLAELLRQKLQKKDKEGNV